MSRSSIPNLSSDFPAVRISFGNRLVLDLKEWSLEAGRTALLGLNGSGKSTLLRFIAGLQESDSGLVHSVDRSRIVYLPQHFAFPGNFTVTEMLLYCAWLRKSDVRASRARIQDVLRSVGLEDRANERLSKLSGGMLQRAAIAQAVMTSPELLLLDEPTTGLDVEQKQFVYDFVRNATGNSRRLLFSTHQMDDVTALADNVLVLHKRRIMWAGPVSEFTERASGGRVAGEDIELALLSLLERSGGE